MPVRAPLLAVTLLVAGCAAKSDNKRKPETPEAGYVVIQSGAVALPTELAGRTTAFEQAQVRPQVTGIIQQQLFVEGSLVRAGQTLYQIDASTYQATAAQAAAALQSAQAARTAAAARAARYKPLADIEAISKQDYSDAAAQAAQGTASVAQAQAAVAAAQVTLRYTRVPAPIGGRIGRSSVTQGGLVTANQPEPLTTIQRLDPIYVDVQQSSADLLKLRRGLATQGVVPSSAQVRLTLEDGSDYGQVGTLQFAEATVDAATGTVTLRARFPNPQGLLLPGMYVRARLSQATVTDAILVPQVAVSRDGAGSPHVLIVATNGTAEARSIVADRTVGDQWLVTKGLTPGDKVIVEGLGKIKPGGKIVPVPAGSPPRRRPPKPASQAAGA
jgi:membrane fusion protein (multidrug efflux system)